MRYWDNSSFSNCTNGGALYVTGNSQLQASAVSVAGTDCVDTGSQILVPNSGVNTGAVAQPDPFSTLPAPPINGCQPGILLTPRPYLTLRLQGATRVST